MKYFVIADRIRVEAFKAMGVDGIYVSDEREGDEALLSAIEKQGISAILLDASIYERNREKISAHESTGRYPVVMKLG